MLVSSNSQYCTHTGRLAAGTVTRIWTDRRVGSSGNSYELEHQVQLVLCFTTERLFGAQHSVPVRVRAVSRQKVKDARNRRRTDLGPSVRREHRLAI